MKNVLIHACCAPCSTAAIETLQKTENVVAFFYNPNIHSVSEYNSRASEMKQYGADIGITVQEGDYDIKEWFSRVKGLEWVAEKSRDRCEPCIRMRLEKTAAEAREGGFDAFSTTLSISPHKDAVQINRIGKEVASQMGINFVEADFKQNGGFARSVELTKQKGIRRQNYCGCVFSRLERKRHAKIET